MKQYVNIWYLNTIILRYNSLSLSFNYTKNGFVPQIRSMYVHSTNIRLMKGLSGNFSIRFLRQYMSLFTSIATIVSLLLTFDRKSSHCSLCVWAPVTFWNILHKKQKADQTVAAIWFFQQYKFWLNMVSKVIQHVYHKIMTISTAVSFLLSNNLLVIYTLLDTENTQENESQLISC